ncbi:MAG: ATP-binding cassette domain-containing protein [Clostridiaceae bacterium]|nr:ATP-binding cassette domain-containing protein [Clostridiaceae bacterium]
MKQQQSIIKFEDVSFVRDGKTILDKINFEMLQDQNWVILGPNGSGKSVLFSMIFAYNIPTKGKVKVFGKEFGKTNWRRIKRKMRIVSSVLDRFENVLSRLTAMEVIISGLKDTFGLYESIKPNEEQKAYELMQEFDFLHKKDSLYKNFSAGEKKKTLILRALITEPEILILDEPCASLDIFQKKTILSTLDKIDNVNLIYITHDINEILDKFSHVLMLKQGKVFAQGKKDQILIDNKVSKLYNLDLIVEKKANSYSWQIT